MENEKMNLILKCVSNHFGCEAEDIVTHREFTNGKSGSGVFLIEVLKAQNSIKVGNYILKIDSKQSDEFLDEIQNTIELGKYLSNSTIKFPEFEFFDYTEEHLFYIYGVAGSNLMDAVSIVQAYEKGQSVLEKISMEMLFNWNTNFSHRVINLVQLIEEGVGPKRLVLEGRIAQRIQNLIGDNLIPTFTYSDTTYPNPYYYLKSASSPLTKNINALVGNVHGDLNENNIIIKRNIWDKSYDVYMIDYSHYKNDGFLFTDHAYLQLNLLLNERFVTNIYEWCSIVEKILSNTKGKKESDILFTHYIYNGIISFIKKQQTKNEDNCFLQYLCSHIIAGMNMLNKRDMDEKRQALCLLYASIYLRVLLVNLSEQFELPMSQGQLVLLGSNVEKEIWELFGNFDQDENKYFLISACDSDITNKENFVSLSAIIWDGIFEVNATVNNPIREYAFSKFKRTYGLQFQSLPNETKESYEVAPCWCSIQVPMDGNKGVWYNKNIRRKLEALLKKVLSIKENYPIYLVVDTKNINSRVLTSIITDIQGNSGKSLIYMVILDGQNIDMEEDEYTKIRKVNFSLDDIASCLSLMNSSKKDCQNIMLPRKTDRKNEYGQVEVKPVELEEEEVNYISMDFEIVHQKLGWNNENDDFGDAFYRGVEATWKDIAVHRDIDRIDYLTKWKPVLTETLRSIGLNTVIAYQLYHKAGAGGTTLSKRILWDFHTLYPCLLMRKLTENTAERLKLVYKKCGLPILVVVEISAGTITANEMSNFRIELINKGVRALFLYVSRIHNLDSKRYPHRFYLADTPNMIMSDEECQSMYEKYGKLTKDDHCLTNIQKLTFPPDKEWEYLRQPFFYGLFAFEKEYINIDGFVNKGLASLDEKVHELIKLLAFLTVYSQIGLNKMDVNSIFQFEEEQLTEALANPLIVYKNMGYRICHPIIAETILKQCFSSEDYCAELFIYSIKFIDMLTSIYDSESKRLSDILEEIFTHREYYIDEERKKFSNLVMEFTNDLQKKELFQYLIDKLPNNPHYYNHKARVYIYPSDYSHAFDFDEAFSLAQMAIEKSELEQNEGSAIHHHLMGKIYAKQIKVMIHNSTFNESVTKLWKKIKPVYEKAEFEFSQCMVGKNVEFGLVGKMELISGILCKISTRKKSSINAILKRETGLQVEFVKLTQKLQQLSVEYTTKFDTSNEAYAHAILEYKQSLGNIRDIENQLKLKTMTLQSRIQARRALTALELWKNNNISNSVYLLPEDSVLRIHNFMEQNISENGNSDYYDRVMWLKTYMCLSTFDVLKAYNFLIDWPDGDYDQFVCFYRYVFAFILYYQERLDFMTVESHMKQSNKLSQKSYGVSTTSTRELLGKEGEKIYLLHDSVNMDWGKLSNEEREKYRDEHCLFMIGQVESIESSLISIKFSLDNVHSFIAKLPPAESIGGWNQGDMVTFALGFSYSEMRAWNVRCCD
ncbi:MAG: hypothetical protein J1E64_03830 [Acetatifactor sp.]|nr:hypothetical protein [Acetatifactor sp.]